MSKKNGQKWSELDSENQLADQINEKLKLDNRGNKALLLVCVGEFLLIIFFQYLIESVILGQDNFSLFGASIFALIITLVTGYYSYKRRNKNNDKK